MSENDWEIKFPAYRLELFTSKIDKANRRLARAGMETRFVPTIERFTVKKIKGGIELPDGTTMFGTEVEEPWVKATMPEVEIAIGPYVFVASLVREEAGYTVHTAPGHDLSTWQRPAVDDMHCDHCGTNRIRNRLYVIRNTETDELLQVGHNCIELYTGLSPKGLWALQFDEELRSFADEDSVGGGFAHTDYGVEIRRVLAYAWVFSDHGRSYIPSGWDREASTVSVVRTALFVPPRPPYKPTPQAMAEYRQYLADLTEADRVYREESDLLDAIIKVAETIDATSDYGQNMNVILAGERVSGRNVGILASLVKVYARELELEVKRASAPKPAEGYLAPVKERIRSEIRVTLKTVRYWEGDYGTTTFMVGYTPDMHCVVWKASGSHDVNTGDVLVLSAATVKAHEQYHGTDQTVLTRCKIDRVEQAETQSA